VDCRRQAGSGNREARANWGDVKQPQADRNRGWKAFSAYCGDQARRVGREQAESTTGNQTGDLPESLAYMIEDKIWQ